MKNIKIYNIYNATTNELLYSVNTELFSFNTIMDIISDIITNYLNDDIDILFKIAYKN